MKETQLGYELNAANLMVFFGKSEATFENLKAEYPQITFCRLKQIHSDAVVETQNESSDYKVLADAHWTSKKNLGLCVITADCIPILFYNQSRGLIAGVHAGWRGVASQILEKTIISLKEKGIQPSDLQVFIGPHIHRQSFEIGLDVRDILLSTLGPLSLEERKAYFEPSQNHEKVLLDLRKVIGQQLSSLGILSPKITSLDIDTYTDTRFNSYRRDKEKSGRQISFIAQTS